HPQATVTVNGGDPAAPVQLAVGGNTIEIVGATGGARHPRPYGGVGSREAASSNADLAGLTAEAGADGAWSALDLGAFAAGTTSYAVSVPYAKTHARLTATAADAAATVTGGAEVALEVGENALSVEVTAADGTATKTYTVTVTREAEGPRLTASFGGRPYEHDGATAFRFVVLLSEPLGAGAGKVTAASFEVTNGRVASVREIKSDYYFVHVRPDGWKDVTVTLRGGRDCAEAGAVCAGDGRRLSNSPSMTLDGPAAPALTATLENVPAEHDGGAAFAIDLRFSEALGEGGVAPSAASFAVQAGDVAGVERVSAGLWRVRVQPKNWKDVTVTLRGGRDCAEAGAVCAGDGRRLSNSPS
ncbi:MAG: cadherin-like beta sandwich domain-containing protein, partial [Chloroflexi bacterium]|nr:cadherin-like beta sandwich domain-containing protein [Chloroflexota bacterium]